MDRVTTFQIDEIIDPSEVNDEFDQILDWINGKVSNSNIATDADIEGSKLAISPNGVPADRINDGAVISAKIGNNQILTSHILNGNVTTDKLANLGVTTPKIADGSVTAAKLAAGAVSGSLLNIVKTTVSRVNFAYTFAALGVLYLDLSQITPATSWAVSGYPADMLDGLGAIQYIPIAVVHRCIASTTIPIGQPAGAYGEMIKTQVVLSDTSAENKRYIIAFKNEDHTYQYVHGVLDVTDIYFLKLT